MTSLCGNDTCEKFKDKHLSFPSRPTSRENLLPIHRSVSLNFSNEIMGESNSVTNTYAPKIEVKGKETKDWSKETSTKHISESSYMKEKKDEEEKRARTKDETISPTQTILTKNLKDNKKMEHEFVNNIEYYIKKKICVWCRIATGQWKMGKIQYSYGDAVDVMLSKNDVVKVSMEEIYPANPDILEGIEDLIQLSYLNEPSVLYNLRARYSQDLIYSKAGSVLIAINPFKRVQIYEKQFLLAYKEKALDVPHVYAVTVVAYNAMMKEKKNQSIIISGDSGAGKTETAKYAMQYMEVLGGSSFGVENEVLKANCILEAFGNAKTSRNSNSSRFGKLMEIHFSASGKICGARLETFLLEKSRVVRFRNGERSYHIFYELCAGASPILREKLRLKTTSEYSYLNQSHCLTIDHIDDAHKFHKLMEAFNIVQIPKEYQERVLSLLAAVLWLGNVSFEVIDNENHVGVVEDEAITNVAMLLSCNLKELMVVLSTYTLQAGRDSIAKRLTLRQAIDMRDSLAKLIYANLFNWLVEQINNSLEMCKSSTRRSISILDIYGFESFKNNSFEQFCINYANERLQQHFNRHLFKLEQEEYEEEGIDWTKVEFKDNQECINLIEKKPIGLISLLDEESSFPKATDTTFANKLKQHLKANSCFKGERGQGFTVNHYAGEVLYHTNGFLEKNRDPLHTDLIQLLSLCKCHLLNLFSTKMRPKFANASTLSDSMNQSVITKFKGQLSKLMNKLEDTTPHFIRCIKPNSKQLPGLYEDSYVLQQLRGCGILEIVRISRSRYPTRLTHQELAGRYGFLLLDTKLSQDPLSLSDAIMKQHNILPEMYQVGYTKIYLRTNQIGFLEERRKCVLHAILGLQKHFRCYQSRKYFQNMGNAAVIIQSCIRGEIARRNHIVVEKQVIVSPTITKELDAAMHLQSMVRKWLARQHLNSMQQKKHSHNEKKKPSRKSRRRISEDKVQFSAFASLHSRLQKVEATLIKKEDENNVLREELHRLEERWEQYETRIKLMEETWKNHMSSMHTSHEAICKILDQDKINGHGNDSDDTISIRTPTKEVKGSLDVVNSYPIELNQRRVVFDEDVKCHVEVKLEPNVISNNKQHAQEELRGLKLRFEKWKKGYKARLHDTKARIHLDGDKSRNQKCWCKNLF